MGSLANIRVPTKASNVDMVISAKLYFADIAYFTQGEMRGSGAWVLISSASFLSTVLLL